MLLLSLLWTGCGAPCSTGYALNSEGNCIPFALDTSGEQRYHPDGFDEPGMHSIEAKLGVSTCTECHGADLTGADNANSCDQCHDNGWRTNCTFCHGGDINNTGAPPRDLDGGETDASFGAHSTHVTGVDHMEYDCSECHNQPEKALSSGHMFDSSPGVSEVAFNSELNPGATWNDGSCGNLYCHSNAQGDLGSPNSTDEVKCGDCHAAPDAGPSAWNRMSGGHGDHLQENISCSECHERTINEAGDFIDPSLHVNGTIDISIPSLTYTEALPDDPVGNTCDGICHNEAHDLFLWER